MNRARLRGVLLVVLATAFPAVANAQIYAWRDTSGNWVLSNTPKDPSALTFPVTPKGTYRTTKATSSRRSAAYDPLIEQHAATHGLSSDLVRAVIQAESAFNPGATSTKGAMGLMQLMPATATDYGVMDPYDPAQNIRAGVAYLKKLLVKYGDNLELALAAYNAGPGAVEKYGKVPPYRETRNYVSKIKDAVGAAPPAPSIRIYRTIVMIDGRPVPKYSTKPSPGAELVTAATRR